MKTDEIISLYKETKSINETVKISGWTKKIVYMILQKNNLLDAQTRSIEGPANTRLGAVGEIIFQQLVPEAVSANDITRKNNPDFDYKVGDLNIDIKASRYSVKTNGWGANIRTSKNGSRPDLYVMFLLEENAILSNPVIEHILLIPTSIFYDNQTNTTFSKSSPTVKEYDVSNEELHEQIMLMRDLKAQGLI